MAPQFEQQDAVRLRSRAGENLGKLKSSAGKCLLFCEFAAARFLALFSGVQMSSVSLKVSFKDFFWPVRKIPKIYLDQNNKIWCILLSFKNVDYILLLNKYF